MKTVPLPHGHSCRRARSLVLGVALFLAALPAMAVPPSLEPAEDGSPVVLSPDTSVLHALPEIATPDVVPTAGESKSGEMPSSSRIKTLLQRAFALLGTPYRWGGANPENGFDCSGLVGYVFRSVGIELPRVSRAMAAEGVRVDDRSALSEGDLVFFSRGKGRIDHVGIYVGGGKFLHAPRTGRDVTVSDLASGYWSQKFVQARRIASGS